MGQVWTLGHVLVVMGHVLVVRVWTGVRCGEESVLDSWSGVERG